MSQVVNVPQNFAEGATRFLIAKQARTKSVEQNTAGMGWWATGHFKVVAKWPD